MKNRIIVSLFLLISFISSLPYTVNAQCPMCKQSLTSARMDGDTSVGNTLNNGIIYLFVFPYILAMVFVFLYIRNTRAKKKLNQNQ
ncbi:MAG: hypothetical protein V4538_12535 [Bacteroidota bacterium]